MMWCMENSVTIKAAHIPGKRNSIADGLSRNRIRHTEWRLNPESLRSVFLLLGQPVIDLFATKLNKQLPVVCLPNCRRGCPGCRCPVNVMERDVCVSFSSLRDTSKGSSEDKNRTVLDNSSGPILAEAELVPQHSGSFGRETSKDLGVETPVNLVNQPQANSSGSLKPSNFSICCMEIVKQQFIEKGFSSETAERAASCRQHYTNRTYNTRVRSFMALAKKGF